MNINKLKEIINTPMATDEMIEHEILRILSEDKDLIPNLLEILQYEREEAKELRLDLNLELGRAHLVIRDKKMYKKLQAFVDEEICKFYQKWKGKIGHCFANMDTLKPNHEPTNHTNVDQSDPSKPGY